MEKIYTFQLGELVHLSDPCYNNTSESTEMCGDFSKFNVPCYPGLWDAIVYKNSEGYIQSVQYSHDNSLLMHNANYNQFIIGVDSGQFGIFDASIWSNESDYHDEKGFYRQCCNVTLSDESCGTLQPIMPKQEYAFGFVSSTGYGDGCYNVDAYFFQGKLVKAIVTFIPPEGEQGEEEDEEYYEDFF